MILNNFEETDLDLFYEYVIDLQPQNMNIYTCLNKAREFAKVRNEEAEKEKLKHLNINQYEDFGDILGGDYI